MAQSSCLELTPYYSLHSLARMATDNTSLKHFVLGITSEQMATLGWKQYHKPNVMIQWNSNRADLSLCPPFLGAMI
jgi:hypothetical protein